MSKPSFSNIDLWLFEYAEGNLTPDQEAQLELFILQHPELDVDRDMWEMAKVKQEDFAYPQEQSLYRRKPVGLFWSIGAGVSAMAIILLGSYFFFGQEKSGTIQSLFTDDSKTNSEVLIANAGFTRTELELRQEIADLKSLVTSLESELSRNRGSIEYSDLAILETNNAQEHGTDIITSESYINTNTSANSQLASDSQTQSTALSNEAAMNGVEVSEGLQSQSHTATGTSEIAPLQNMTSIGAGVLATQPRDLQPVTSSAFANDWDAEMRQSNAADQSNDQARLSTNYESSYKHKISKLLRRIRRMADNPIALKNYRDPYHHVPGLTATDLNFGATGTMIAPRLQTMSRLQWYGNPNELFSNQIALDGYVYGLRGGVGVQMTHNYYNQGGIQTGEVAVTYSPKFSVNQKLSIEPAVRFKMGSKILDAERMNGQSQVEMLGGNAIDYYTDGTQPVGSMLWYRDMGLGLNVNTEWFYASAQVDNMFRHRDNIYSNDLTEKRRAGTYFVATVGTDWESNDSQWETKRSKFSLSPYLVYRSFEDINELWAGANFRAYWLTLGASISTNQDPAASIGIVSSDKRFSLMYNVDYMRSIMTNERSLSHQLTLRIVGKQSKGRRILNQ